MNSLLGIARRSAWKAQRLLICSNGQEDLGIAMTEFSSNSLKVLMARPKNMTMLVNSSGH